MPHVDLSNLSLMITITAVVDPVLIPKSTLLHKGFWSVVKNLYDFVEIVHVNVLTVQVVGSEKK